MKKPKPLIIDDECFKIEKMISTDNIELSLLSIQGPRLYLSPYEAEQLRDWLNKALEYIDNVYSKQVIHKRKRMN